YLGLTENTLFKGSASLTMQALRQKISQLGITGSAGISNQKMVAKIASDERKPDGQFLVTPEQIYEYISQLDLKRIPGVGPKSQKLLAQHGLIKGLDIQAVTVSRLQEIIGEKAGYLLHQRCQGIDKREVVTERVRKSVGVEQTL
ncbi:MAG TPA: DNA polymerase IV, partial [Idiomarina sp.]|nr:DNA polymerase IV [Idiomarina sp.]